MKALSRTLVGVLTLSLASTAICEDAGRTGRRVGAKTAAAARKAVKAMASKLNTYLDGLDKTMRRKDLGSVRQRGAFVSNKASMRLESVTETKSAGDTAAHQVAQVQNAKRFLNEVEEEAQRALAWKMLVDADAAEMQKAVDDGPKKTRTILEAMRWADRQIRESRRRGARARTLAELQRELSTFGRVRAVVANVAEVLKEQKKRIEAWLADDKKSPDAHRKGLKRLKRFEGKVDAKQGILPAVSQRVRRSVEAWKRAGAISMDTLSQARTQFETNSQPIRRGTVLSSLESFRGLGPDRLLETVEQHERALRARIEALKRR